MRIKTGLRRLAAASVGLLALGVAASAQTAEVYFRDSVTRAETRLSADSPTLRGRLPVLFVHGHNLISSNDLNRNYRKNWQDSLGNLPSFMQTLDLHENDGLGIEDYYIRFREQGRSIAEDAAEISDAIDLILHRHDPLYDYPHNQEQTTSVKVVIIAYSKGTISARLYLKNLQTERPGFRPVSEFIAIAPPNHGTNGSLGGNTTATQQLMNGYDASCTSFGNATEDFIATLNGHPISETQYNPAAPAATPDNYPSEAPDSRSPTERPADGILYVTLFADENRDFVGGDTIILPPDADCQGRRLALNLSPDAVNIPVPEVSDESHILFVADGDPLAVHQNTVHTEKVMCLALYAAVHHRSPRGQDCASVGGKPVIPPPARAAAMLTLDFSGSMSSRACPTCANTRADVLKEAVELFVRLWSAVGVPGDRVGLTYFRTDVTQFTMDGEPLPLLRDAADGVIADVGGQAPRNSTAMGGGLQLAIGALKDADAPIRRVILFTDGMQNVNPMVQAVDGQWVINTRPGHPNSNVLPAEPPTTLNSSLGIAVDTIGVGAGDAFVGLLQDIASATGGHTLLTTAPDDDLRRLFIEQLINALRGFSPQLVAYRRGVVAAQGSTEAFAIEDGVRTLVLKVSWRRGDSLDFSVAKDGVDVTSAGRLIAGDFYKIFVIDLPAKGPLTARGDWHLLIKGKAATAYEAAAIIDGGLLKYDATFNVGRPRAGDPLELVVRFTVGGRPVVGSAKVTVTLRSPKTAAGDISATIKPKELPSLEPGMNAAERRWLALTQDPKKRAALEPRQQTVVLQPTDRGEYRARLDPQVPGVYTALVTIEGDDAKLGRFSRTMTATTVVRFAAAGLKADDISVNECNVGARRYARLILLPRDARGHRMGPGLSSAISLRFSAGRTVGGIRDLGDGRYMLVLELVPGDDPTINLETAGGTLFSGRFSQLSAMSSR